MVALNPDQFAQAVRLGPLVAIDLLPFNRQGQVLLGLRSKRPAQNSWFVPGGRVHKDERLAAAMERISQAELGQTIVQGQVRFLGVYEHFYSDNFLGDPSFGTHYIVLAYAVDFEAPLENLPAAQHGLYRWFTVEELLAHPDVHPNMKAYFK